MRNARTTVLCIFLASCLFQCAAPDSRGSRGDADRVLELPPATFAADLYVFEEEEPYPLTEISVREGGGDVCGTWMIDRRASVVANFTALDKSRRVGMTLDESETWHHGMADAIARVERKLSNTVSFHPDGSCELLAGPSSWSRTGRQIATGYGPHLYVLPGSQLMMESEPIIVFVRQQ